MSSDEAPPSQTPRPRPPVLDLRQVPAQEIAEFIAVLERRDRTFLKHDTVSLATIEAWQRDPATPRLVSRDDQGRVAGLAAVVPGHGYSQHVGQLMVAVRPDDRAQGHGSVLAREAVHRGHARGLTKFIVEVTADQTPVIEMFQAMGFTPEALFEDHIIDEDGIPADLIVLAQRVTDDAPLFAAVGLQDAEA